MKIYVKRRKDIDEKSSVFPEKKVFSQENVYDGVSYNKDTNLQCSDCNFAIKIINYRYFVENVPSTSCLKKPYFEQKVCGGSAS